MDKELSTFYSRFCALCKTHGKTPSAVLEDIGLTRMNASLWKKGSMPSSTNLQKLADYFEVPLDYLMGTNDSITVDVRPPWEVEETISDAEIEKDKIMLKNLIEQVDTIPKRYRNEAIHEMSAIVQYVLNKYKTMVPNESFIGP